MAPPSDYSTLNSTMLRAKECIDALGHEYWPIFFDMGILTRASEITWSKPRDISGAIPCEGGMHLLIYVFAE